jgi:hypothetical protein
VSRIASIRHLLPALALVFLVAAQEATAEDAAARRIADREGIEDVLSRANLGFELSDPDLFSNAFAEDAVYQLDEKGPVFGFDKMMYRGRAAIRSIITDRVEKASKRDPKTLSFDPNSLKMYHRNTDEHIVIVDAKTARHTSTWMAVIKTNVDIHISAIGRYDDTLEKRNGKWLIAKRVRRE